MILTQCAVCATDLGLTLGKKCGRCSTRYCGPECQEQHWKEGGHDKLCKKIKKAGGAEQYYANNRYTEAVSVAAEACAEDTKGQTCYICTQALHWKTKEGLVRGCSCRGTAGFAHVSCLAEQVKILVAEGEENNLGLKVMNDRWHRWERCSTCKQRYHGVVNCALSWACWKTYVGRPETDQVRQLAMSLLGNGLHDAEHYEDALFVRETELSMLRRLGSPEYNILAAKGNLAISYEVAERMDEALRIRQYLYARVLQKNGEEHRETLIEANNLANLLFRLDRFEEVKSLLRRAMPTARRAIGDDHELTLRIWWSYGRTLYRDPNATLDDVREAVTTIEDTVRIARRVMGGAHALTSAIERHMGLARAALRARETPSGSA